MMIRSAKGEVISRGPIIKQFTATARRSCVSWSLILDGHDIIIDIVVAIIVAFTVGGTLVR